MTYRTCYCQRVDKNSNLFKCTNPESDTMMCIYHSDVEKCPVIGTNKKYFMYISYDSDYSRMQADLNEMMDSGELDEVPIKLTSMIYELIELFKFRDRDLYDLRNKYNSHRHFSYDDEGELATSEPIEDDE